MSLRTDDFDFHLPEELIASRPLENRSASRMLVLHKDTGRIEHRHFTDFQHFLKPNDLVVLNDTRVIPARFFSDDQSIELVKLHAADALHWQCMVRPGKKMKVGREVILQDIRGEVVQIMENGDRIIRWDREIDTSLGQLALPHYMNRDSDSADFDRYQTVFAREEGAIAAPTAGLHFTPEILENISHTFLTLHVGIGTFRPVKAARVEDHDMHSERYQLSAASAASINAAERVVAVGTTVTRVLEHLARSDRSLQESAGETNIFIYPPYEFQCVGALLTNFHLPKSTLLMLVSAFAGKENILHAYNEAVRERYRFYSYGDCMLII